MALTTTTTKYIQNHGPRLMDQIWNKYFFLEKYSIMTVSLEGNKGF